ELDLVRRSDRDTNRLGRPESLQRADDHTLAEQALEHGRAVADLDEEEVADRRAGRLEPVRAQHRRELVAPRGVRRPPAAEAPFVAEARDGGRLRDRVDVERTPDLARRCDDLCGSDAVADPEAGEAVDLRARAQDD